MIDATVQRNCAKWMMVIVKERKRRSSKVENSFNTAARMTLRAYVTNKGQSQGRGQKCAVWEVHVAGRKAEMR